MTENPHFLRRILVVEDNAVNQLVAVGMLGALGLSADLANNGLEALQALHKHAYGIVLMDIQMPELDGLQATGRIRSDLPAHRQPYIIALTANALPEDEQVCLDAGMDAYLSKPVRRESLADALARAESARPGNV